MKESSRKVSRKSKLEKPSVQMQAVNFKCVHLQTTNVDQSALQSNDLLNMLVSD